MTPGIITVAALVAVTILLVWIGIYFRRHPEKRGSSGAASGVLGGAFDAFAPSAADARAALDEQQRLVVPAPEPGRRSGDQRRAHPHRAVSRSGMIRAASLGA